MRLKETIEAYRRNDPAARSGWEVFWLYNGLHATMYYRVAHWLYEHRLRFLGRWVSQFARRRTGIEIHPAAKIGRRLVIDHGTASSSARQRRSATTACSIRTLRSAARA